MSSAHLIETDIILIKDHIKTNIRTALAEVSADRSFAISSLQEPKEYFIYEHAQGFRPPAVFVIGTQMDFMLQKGQNSINAISRIMVSIVIEDKRAYELTVASWRYQAALYKLLNLTHLVSSDNKVKIVVKVARAEFGPLFSNAQRAGDAQGAFRMEVMLACDVEHYEGLP